MLSAIKRGTLKIASLAAVTISAIAAAMPARAEPVQIKPGQLRLNGNLETPKDKTIGDNEVLLNVLGMLSHYGQETIAALQRNLVARGRSSLAVNLSLGIDDRKGP